MAGDQAVGVAGGIAAFVRARTLTEYPRGGHRWALLLLTVLTAILAAYEFQLAPLLPILLPYLHMSRIGYGYFISFVVLISGISAFYGGPIADRYGRVLMIDVCLGLITCLLFANLLITNVVTFVIIRTSMSVIAGLMAGASAALVRDMSPRLSRSLAFGLLTIGPVGSNWLANYVAGKTLPIYHTWQSQIWIMGFLAIAMYIPILFWLSDLSAELRVQIFRSEIAEMEAEGRPRPAVSDLPSSARDAYARLLRHPEVWLLVIGIMCNLVFYITVQAFGPLMFTDAFHYSPGDAARLNSYFWLANILMLILTGIVSDRLQLRKPIAIIGAIPAVMLMVWWIPMFGQKPDERTLAIVATLMGCLLAIAYVPWAAQFSETLEDISPALQATGWAFFGLVTRAWGAVQAPLSLYVATHDGWGAWVRVAACGLTIYIIAMALSRGPFYKIAEVHARDAARQAAAAAAAAKAASADN
ncbi:MAG TPA: MFS transporter [Candidatus Binataceae bacterium]|nr:MFS transporter [Candidatus Binataceae bacterium]